MHLIINVNNEEVVNEQNCDHDKADVFRTIHGHNHVEKVVVTPQKSGQTMIDYMDRDDDTDDSLTIYLVTPPVVDEAAAV